MFRVNFVRTVHMINRAKVSGTVIDRSEFHRQMLIVRVKRIFKQRCFVNLYLLKKNFLHLNLRSNEQVWITLLKKLRL